MREIQGAMNLLSNIQKRRFLMYAEGKSMNEIARLEDVNPNAVWKSIVSARKKLKKYLQKGV
jgi:DNA-directed RNA polymerase specialized sigma24 family protein